MCDYEKTNKTNNNQTNNCLNTTSIHTVDQQLPIPIILSVLTIYMRITKILIFFLQPHSS